MIRFRKTTFVVMATGLGLALVFLGVCLGLAIAANDNEVEDKQLVMLHVIMRHGARTPQDTYPNDPYINDTFYPVGWGQLTNEGKWQLYRIGIFLRERYSKFLGSHYSPDRYYTQSTGVDRTKASMQTVNAGLWPPDNSQKWGPLDWQPIPVHDEPLDQDMLLLVRKPCANYHIEREKVIQSEEIQQKLKENEELFKNLTVLTGRQIKDFDDVQDVFSTLRAEDAFNLTLPEWTKEYYPEKLLEPTIFSYTLNAYNDQMNRLKGGILLKKLINDWQSKLNHTIKPKERDSFLLGGHDSTIVNLLRTLNVWDPQMPEYGITILFELLRDRNTNEFGVEIYLRNSTRVPPYKLTIPGCQSFCSLDKLVNLTENVVPSNWEEECHTDDPNYEVPDLGGP